MGTNLSCIVTASLGQKNVFWLITAVNAGALTVSKYAIDKAKLVIQYIFAGKNIFFKITGTFEGV